MNIELWKLLLSGAVLLVITVTGPIILLDLLSRNEDLLRCEECVDEWLKKAREQHG